MGEAGWRAGAIRSAPRVFAPQKPPAPPQDSLFSSLSGGVGSRRRAFLGGRGSSEHSSQPLASQQCYFLPSALTPSTRARARAHTRTHTCTHARASARTHARTPRDLSGFPRLESPGAVRSQAHLKPSWQLQAPEPCLARTLIFTNLLRNERNPGTLRRQQ